MNPNDELKRLQRAIDAWSCRRNERPLVQWLRKEIDASGALMHVDLCDWLLALEMILQVEPIDGVWPTAWLAPLSQLIDAVFWYSRPDGTTATVFPVRDKTSSFRWAALLGSNACRDARVKKMIKSVLATIENGGATRSTPGWPADRHALSILRPDGADFVAIDHRKPGATCQFEVFGAGVSWLGPQWSVDTQSAPVTRSKPTSWFSEPSAVLAEWSNRAADARIARCALALRGRSLALVAALVDNPADENAVYTMTVSLPDGVVATAVEGSRSTRLSRPGKRSTAQVLPIALPSLPYPTERGELTAADGALVLKQSSQGKRCWLPLLISWSAARNRRPLEWRVLSVSEKSKNVSSDRAFAARVSWGRGESYVIYHSLARPASRAFLGYQTSARMLVGLFHSNGSVEPLIQID